MRPEKLGPLLLQRLRESKLDEDVLARKELLDRSPDTIRTWSKERLPRGETLNKLWHLLALAGVDSPELEELEPFNWYLGKLLAFNVISLQEAQTICGLKNSQDVLRVIRGDQMPTRVTRSLEELKAEHGDKLKTKMEAAKALLPEVQPAQEPVTTRVQPAPTVATTVQQPETLPRIRKRTAGAAKHLSAALPTLRDLDSEEATDEDRAYLRKLMGERGLFELGNIITRLTSDRSYSMRGQAGI